MKSELNPYLGFKDNTREAMEFYGTVFDAKLEFNTFKEYNASQDPSQDELIMHSVLTAENGIVFMAADSPNPADYKFGSNISMSLSGDDEDELTGYFDRLSAGGNVQQPLAESAWKDKFGMVKDKFGVQWLVNITMPEE